jgi:transposase
MKRKVNHFTDEFKFLVIQEYLNTDISQAELKEKYSIRGNSCILNWMRKFGTSQITEEQINLQRTMSKEEEKTPRERTLEAKVKELEKALSH